jgi:hypothetical protein
MHALAQRGATWVVVAILRLSEEASSEAPFTLMMVLASTLDPLRVALVQGGTHHIGRYPQRARGSCLE